MCPLTLAFTMTSGLCAASGRPDMNRRPLDPQARIRRLARSEGVGQGAIHLEKPSNWVGIGSGESEGVGSRSWLPGSPHADSSDHDAARVSQDCQRATRSGGPQKTKWATASQGLTPRRCGTDGPGRMAVGGRA
jgi:hypothetical protein